MRVPLSWSGDVSLLARAVSGCDSWFWLDGDGSGWSYLGIADDTVIAEPGCAAEFLARLRSGMDSDPSDAEPRGRLRGFSGGWIVCLGYEFGVELMGLQPAEDAEPPGFALRAEVVIACNQVRGVAELRGPNRAAIDKFQLRLDQALRDAEAAETPGSSANGRTALAAASTPVDSSHGWSRVAAQYRRDVESCRTAIADGEAYVLCLTDTARISGVQVDPLALFLRLREDGAALRGGVVVAGGRALISASPERFMSVEAGELSTHPIKGTRPRGSTPEEDARRAEELRSDPKERAENLMIVDLMRNDLSRVCTPGSVAVTGFLRVESHPHVHQLVSTIAGELQPGLDLFDAVTACFPGGSMTGAPKRRAVELLAELERAPRGLYSGCFGWVDRSGDTELAMTIRSVELRADPHQGAIALIGAGGGVTIDSDPNRELAEKELKAAPLIAAALAANTAP